MAHGLQLQHTLFKKVGCLLALFALLQQFAVILQPFWLKHPTPGHGVCMMLADAVNAGAQYARANGNTLGVAAEPFAPMPVTSTTNSSMHSIHHNMVMDHDMADMTPAEHAAMMHDMEETPSLIQNQERNVTLANPQHNDAQGIPKPSLHGVSLKAEVTATNTVTVKQHPNHYIMQHDCDWCFVLGLLAEVFVIILLFLLFVFARHKIVACLCHYCCYITQRFFIFPPKQAPPVFLS